MTLTNCVSSIFKGKYLARSHWSGRGISEEGVAIQLSVDCLHSSFRSYFVNGFFRKLLLFDVNVTFIKMSIHKCKRLRFTS